MQNDTKDSRDRNGNSSFVKVLAEDFLYNWLKINACIKLQRLHSKTDDAQTIRF